MATSRKGSPKQGSSLVFADPPPVQRHRSVKGKWEVAVEELRKSPGKWARFGPLKNPGSALSSIRKREKDVEGLTRTIDGEQYLFLRVLPKK